MLSGVDLAQDRIERAAHCLWFAVTLIRDAPQAVHAAKEGLAAIGKLSKKLAQESKLALANGAPLGTLNKAPLRAGNEAAQKALNGQVLQNKKHTPSSTSNKNQNKDSQDSSLQPTKIRKIETVVECSSYEQALNKALQELGEINQATRKPLHGRLDIGIGKKWALRLQLESFKKN